MANLMKALVLYGPGDLRLESIAKPDAEPGSIVIRVIAAPLWDYASKVIDGSLKFPHEYPLVFGTCCVGRVEDVGADIVSLQPGQLVFCDHIIHARDSPEHRIVLGYHGGHAAEDLKLSKGYWRDGCFAEYARFPSENVHMVNEYLLAQHGVSLSQLTAVSGVMSAIGAANSIQVCAGETVLITPATGFFSSSAVAAVLSLGANVVAVSRSMDILKSMISHFEEDGPRITPVVLTGDVTIDSTTLRATSPGGRGLDAYLDFSSPDMADGKHLQAGLLALRRGGRCCFAGSIPVDVPLPYSKIRVNQLTIVGSFTQSRGDVAQTIRLIERGRLSLRKDVEGEFGLGEFDRALEMANEVRGWEKMVVLMP